MNLKETFKKQGGIKLLKQYWQGGALFTGIGQFLLLGKKQDSTGNPKAFDHFKD